MIWPWVTLVLVLVAGGVLLTLLTAGMMARSLLAPPRMTDAKALLVLKRLSPQDIKLEFETVWFHVRDQHSGKTLRLAGWWIPHPGSRRTVMLIHGYADAKVGAIAWAPLFHALGWNILAIDLRAHGESEGRFTSAGFHERHDLDQVINELRAQRPRETKTMALFGVSLGSAVALATATLCDDIDAVICESPFADYRSAVATHLRLLGYPAGVVRALAIRFAEWLSGARFDDVRPLDLIPRVRCPVMLILASKDVFLAPGEFEAMNKSLASRNNPRDALWEVRDVHHGLALGADAEEYRRRVEEFVSRAS